MNKQRANACQQDINRIVLDSDSLGLESFGFGILNCPSLNRASDFDVNEISRLSDLARRSFEIALLRSRAKSRAFGTGLMLMV